MRYPIIIARGLVGSRLYGLHNKDSDYDYRYIQLSRLKDMLSPFAKIPRLIVEGNKDNTAWELVDFCKHLVHASPNAYELLWSKEFNNMVLRDYYFHHEVEDLLYDFKKYRLKFLSTSAVYAMHREFARAQEKLVKWDQPDHPRTRKSLVTCLRILAQGSKLMYTGDFDPHITDGNLQTRLLRIKNHYVAEDEPTVRIFINDAINDLEEAHVHSKLPLSPDLDWIEDRIAHIYSITEHATLYQRKQDELHVHEGS